MTEFIPIAILLATNAATAIYALFLDARNEQLQGCIKRMERELREARAARWRTKQ